MTVFINGVAQGEGGATTFVALTDTPADFTDDELKVARVNATPDALEFVAFAATYLDDTAGGTDAEVAKAPTSNVVYDHTANTTTAHGAVSAATASKMVVRDAEGQAKFAAPAEAGDALIKGTRHLIAEMPTLTTDKIWKGVAGVPAEVDAPSGGAALTVAETQVCSGTSPTAWTDLDLSGTIGAQATLVLLKVFYATGLAFAVRKNGDTDEFLGATASQISGCAQCYCASGDYGVLLVATDNTGKIEWRTNVAIAVTVDVIAYIK